MADFRSPPDFIRGQRPHPRPHPRQTAATPPRPSRQKGASPRKNIFFRLSGVDLTLNADGPKNAMATPRRNGDRDKGLPRLRPHREAVWPCRADTSAGRLRSGERGNAPLSNLGKESPQFDTQREAMTPAVQYDAEKGSNDPQRSTMWKGRQCPPPRSTTRRGWQ